MLLPARSESRGSSAIKMNPLTFGTPLVKLSRALLAATTSPSSQTSQVWGLGVGVAEITSAHWIADMLGSNGDTATNLPEISFSKDAGTNLFESAVSVAFALCFGVGAM